MKILGYNISAKLMLFFILAIIVSFSAINNKPWHKKYITSDGFGYYGYLPAVFIYDDLQFGFIETTQRDEYKDIGSADFRREAKNSVINICYVGTSILWTPFFLASHAYAHISHYEPNGFTYPYQVGILLAGIFYLFIGLWALGVVLLRLKCSMFTVSVSLISIIFATPLLYYSVVEPSFSHVYSFALINLFVLTLSIFFEKFSFKYLFLSVVLAALIGLIRPINGLLLLVILPICLPQNFSFFDFFQRIKGKLLVRLFLLPIIFIAIVFIQPIIYFIQTGSFFVWSYQGEGFNFLNPQILNILFSYKKGLFTYTPILLFTFFGLYSLYRSYPAKAVFVILGLLVNIFVLSSWWSWWFGMSLAHRAFIDFYALWFIPIAFGFDRLGTIYKTVYITFLLLFGLYFQVLTEQYKNYVLYWDMDKHKFWRVFMQTSRPYHGLFWEDDKSAIRNSNILNSHPFEVLSLNFNYEDQHDDQSIKVGIAHSGFSSKVISTGETVLFKSSITDSVLMPGSALLVQGSFYITQLNRKEPVVMSVKLIRGDSIIFSQEKSLNKSRSFIYQWNRISILSVIESDILPSDQLIVTIINHHSSTVLFDDMYVNLRLPKN